MYPITARIFSFALNAPSFRSPLSPSLPRCRPPRPSLSRPSPALVCGLFSLSLSLPPSLSMLRPRVGHVTVFSLPWFVTNSLSLCLAPPSFSLPAIDLNTPRLCPAVLCTPSPPPPPPASNNLPPPPAPPNPPGPPSSLQITPPTPPHPPTPWPLPSRPRLCPLSDRGPLHPPPCSDQCPV